eukprot:TRINITY_DN3586_c0_g1_i4.p1 TRINITY_DN3586_c0_g1~~TRINITY_DN3586_c0_g1_i4.p1  ORF type:complete len:474 (+),score=64.72 TRINITY_DN3586_c0_g1_i4:61-1422(+)
MCIRDRNNTLQKMKIISILILTLLALAGSQDCGIIHDGWKMYDYRDTFESRWPVQFWIKDLSWNQNVLWAPCGSPKMFCQNEQASIMYNETKSAQCVVLRSAGGGKVNPDGWAQLETGNPVGGFEMNYTLDKPMPELGIKKIVVRLRCDFEVKTNANQTYEIQGDTFFYGANSRSGCQTATGMYLLAYLTRNMSNTVITVLSLAIGLFLWVYAAQFWAQTFFLMGFLTTYAIFGGILFELVGLNTINNVIIGHVLNIVSLAVAVFGGFAVCRSGKLAFPLAGAWLGFFVASIINSVSYDSIYSDASPALYFAMYAFILMVVGAVIVSIKKGFLFCAGVGSVGGYLIVRGIGFAFGGYPSEFMMSKYFLLKNVKEISFFTGTYTILVICLAAAGSLVVQNFTNKVIQELDSNRKYQKLIDNDENAQILNIKVNAQELSSLTHLYGLFQVHNTQG